MVLAHANVASIPNKYQGHEPVCSLEAVANQFPLISENDIIATVIKQVEYRVEEISKKLTNDFIIVFYRANGPRFVDKTMQSKNWINREEFDVLLIYEVDEKNEPRTYPVGFAYVRGTILFSSYTVSGNEEMWWDRNKVVNYFQKSSCGIIHQGDTNSAIVNLLRAISAERFREIHRQVLPK